MYPTHKDCAHYKDGWCTLNGVKIDPYGPACPRFQFRAREIGETKQLRSHGKNQEIETLKLRLNELERKMNYVKGKLNQLRYK